MKYEMIFGDEALFDGAPDDAEMAYETANHVRVYYKKCNSLKFFSNSKWVRVLNEKAMIIHAMRRIIKEPKRWTWEDKKAGRLPDVGSDVMAIGVNEVARIAAINNDSVCSVCVVFEDGGFSTLHFSGIAPIETPEEKAQRLRSEWVKHALDLYMSSPKNDAASMGDVYDALLSGELQVPKGE